MSKKKDSKKKDDSKNDEDLKTLGDLRNLRTRILPKNKPGFFGARRAVLHDDLDKNCLYEFTNKFIRIEYPGRVKNVDKAIETLGGMHEIHLAVEGKKLELTFNPKNQYNKGCVADKDTYAGLLVKIIQHDSSQEYSYEVIGPTSVNFKFNRMSDFQYLPLVAKNEPENEESEIEYVYDKIISDKIPSLEWFIKKDQNNAPAFLIASNFARYDTPQATFQLNSAKTLISLLRPDLRPGEYPRVKGKQSNVVPSIRLSFTKSITNIPDQPLSNAMKVIKEKFLQKHYSLVKSYFQERPVWRRAGIMHKTNISLDAAKFVLPCLAYYCSGGPWRSCWIRFGYDPLKDYNSRIYQVLDYRIRSTEGMKLKIKSKRGSLAHFIGDSSSRAVCERDYILRPNILPPARQMFYNYCDILIPEIQEMVSKLPKLPPTAKYDYKNGWLPLSFQEHCREIVNRYIFEAVQQEVLETQMQEKTKQNTENVTSYCSKMLTNIRQGVHQSIGEYSGGNTSNQENIIDEIYLSDDEENNLEQIDATEVVNSLPERIPENFEDDDESDLEIDMEAVEEVNEIVSGIKDQKLSF